MKDLVNEDRVSIQYCNTTKMVADFFTKSLQGRLFRTLKAVVLGQITISDFMKEFSITPVSKELVGR